MHAIGSRISLIQDLLLVAAAIGSKRHAGIEVTFTRQYGYVVTKDEEVI